MDRNGPNRQLASTDSEYKMRPIENLSNWLTDMDWGWWPVLHLRPQKNQNINNRVLLKITPYFGSVSGVIIFFPGFVGHYSVISFTFSIIFGWIAFFLVYKVTCAAAWNKRAANLRSAKNM